MAESEPTMGTLKRNLERTRQMPVPRSAMKKYGTILARTSSIGFTGVTKRDSNVPLSHSRAMTTEVSMTPIIVMISMTRPGMKNHVLELALLYHMRGSTVTVPKDAAPDIWRASQEAIEVST